MNQSVNQPANQRIRWVDRLHQSLHTYFVTRLNHMQMGGAPEVAAHLERMQPASAPAARLLRPAALAGALMKPSKHALLSHIVHTH